jgi:hypothetical protein
VTWRLTASLVVRRLGLPPLELAASPYRQFNRHFEFTFDKVSNRYLFSKNHQKLNIYIYKFKIRAQLPPLQPAMPMLEKWE